MSDTIELHIDAMAYGGKGIGRIDGKVYFVLDAVVGDHLTARITQDSGRYADAEIVKLLQPSHLRGASSCAFASACGGCQWQGIDYEQQLAWKLGFVTASLKRIGKIADECTVNIRPSPNVQAYRNRILLRARLKTDGSFEVGYFQRQSRELVSINRCEIAVESINNFIKVLLKTKLPMPESANPSEQKFRFEIQEILSETEKRLVVVIHPSEKARPHIVALENIITMMRGMPQVLWAGSAFTLNDAPLVDFDRAETSTGSRLLYKTLPGQFQQVNVAHNHNLRHLVEEIAQRHAPQRVLDVCCGSGNLSLALISEVCHVEGVEANDKAIAVARKNMQANGITNATYVTGDSERHLLKCAKAQEKFDLVILDPPRQGLHQGMAPLKQIAPKTIIYVSCDPTTLARDIGTLCRNDQYRVISITAFDFFPNTFHVETVVELELVP